MYRALAPLWSAISLKNTANPGLQITQRHAHLGNAGLRGAFAFQGSNSTTLSKAGFSVRNPAYLPIRMRSLRFNYSISLVLFMVGGRRL